MKRHSIRLLKYLIVITAFVITLYLFSHIVTKSHSDKLSMLEMHLKKLRLKKHHNNAMPKAPVDSVELRESDVKQAVKTENAERHAAGDRIKNIQPKDPENHMLQLVPKVPEEEKEKEKINWHDYVQIETDLKRTGFGEQSKPVDLPKDMNISLRDAIFNANGFNGYVSDKIALDRALHDLRPELCRTKTYWNKLLTVSIVVPFYNEHWSTLLRTVVSVINRAPQSLLMQVVLVDDGSTKEHCKQQLDDYVKENFSIVKVIHLTERQGLIRARLEGAKAAMGDVLLFLDSHVEASINYLPPLIEPISENYRTVVCPQIDVIDFDNFAVRAQDGGARGAFDWSFFYKRLPKLAADKAQPAEIFKSPVMAGGLFAISAKWFWEIGGYDSGLEVWGAEQYEISFKIWMCGGQMYDAPCSRFGHVFRKYSPFSSAGKGNYYVRNHRRVAEVWMDEWKDYLYKRNPHWLKVETGNLTEQKALRERLNCKSFDWFMKEIAFDLTKRYPPDPPGPFFTGQIQNVAANLCVDAKFGSQSLTLNECTKDSRLRKIEQDFEMTFRGEIKLSRRGYCLDASVKRLKAPVTLHPCHMQGQNQRWKYNVNFRQIFHPVTNQCLDYDPTAGEVFMNPCIKRQVTQKWTVKNIDSIRLRDDWIKP